jgi:cellulose synthase/poly-beta-1,6-N-acetylglucosamine synthase-like glycosyltransferase
VIVDAFEWAATAAIVAIFAHAIRLWFVSRTAEVPPSPPAATGEFMFAFLVPALNEERVIGHTLDRLLALPVRHSMILVIDDGSDDATSRVVERCDDPRVRLLRRELPLARLGKGAALNAGLGQLVSEVDGWPADKVIVGIMDADGRLDPRALDQVAGYFADGSVGAVQLAVRIYNRDTSALARLQDMEFVTYTDVFQGARDTWGVAGLGGNGQFVRLSAHLDLAPAPWTDGLTEDLEQGLRLICAGWRTRYCRGVAVHQQGLESAQRLLRQRSRWFQGHLQAWRQIRGIIRHAPLRRVPHLLHFLMAPVLLLANAALLAALCVMLAGIAVSPAIRSVLVKPGTAVAWYWLTFALAMFLTGTVYARREAGLKPRRIIVLGHAFAGYSLLWMVAGYWAMGRILCGRRGWLKTERLAEHATRPPSGLEAARPSADLEVAQEDAY